MSEWKKLAFSIGEIMTEQLFPYCCCHKLESNRGICSMSRSINDGKGVHTYLPFNCHLRIFAETNSSVFIERLYWRHYKKILCTLLLSLALALQGRYYIRLGLDINESWRGGKSGPNMAIWSIYSFHLFCV